MRNNNKQLQKHRSFCLYSTWMKLFYTLTMLKRFTILDPMLTISYSKWHHCMKCVFLQLEWKIMPIGCLMISINRGLLRNDCIEILALYREEFTIKIWENWDTTWEKSLSLTICQKISVFNQGMAFRSKGGITNRTKIANCLNCQISFKESIMISSKQKKANLVQVTSGTV